MDAIQFQEQYLRNQMHFVLAFQGHKFTCSHTNFRLSFLSSAFYTYYEISTPPSNSFEIRENFQLTKKSVPSHIKSMNKIEDGIFTFVSNEKFVVADQMHKMKWQVQAVRSIIRKSLPWVLGPTKMDRRPEIFRHFQLDHFLEYVIDATSIIKNTSNFKEIKKINV